MTTNAHRLVAFALGVSTMVVMSGFLLVAAPPQAVGTWEVIGTTDPSSARSGAATATLADGSTFVAGGRLGDGTVTDSVVVYDPLTNASTTVGHLLSPRVNAAAARLDDGRVFVVGGEVGALLIADAEIFDPSTGTSVIVGAMAQPRTRHAAARLADGRVLIVGGATVDDVALASVEIFDPETFGMLPAGSMAVPRVGATATLLIDNRVLVVGGNSGNGTPDLASAELYHPFSNEFVPVDTQLSVARSGHTATLLPHNGAVLVAGGTAAGVPVTDVDLFLPAMFPDPYSWGMGSFAPAAPLFNPRSQAVSGPAGDDGYAFVAGGGVPVGEAFAFTTLKTDKDDYAPGEPALITGSGWQPDEEVRLVFQEDPAVHPDYTLTLTADGEGNISHGEWAPEEHDLGVRFFLMATGQQSHRQAQTTFTDASAVNVVIVSSANPSIVGNSVTFTATVRNGNDAGSGTPVTVGTVKFGTGNNCTGGFTAFSAGSTLLTLDASGQASYAHTFATTTGSPFTVRACYIGTGGSGTQDDDESLSQTVNDATGPTKLAITSVNSGINPTYGNSFSVVVESQNASSTTTNVTAATGFSFTVATGDGTLTGTVSGTISAGQSSTTVTGVTYSKAQNGVSLTATRTSGDTLAPGASALFNVLKRSITVTASSHSVAYGDPVPVVTPSYATFVSPDNAAGIDTAPTCTTTYTTASAALSAQTTSCLGGLDNNYSFIYMPGTVTVNKRLITVTPTAAQSKYYGDLDPTLAYGFTPALVAGDSFTGALARDPGVNVGFYNITQGNLALSDNYTLTFTSGVQFEIKKLVVTVTPTAAQSKYYGDLDPTLAYGFTPALVAGDSFTGALARDPGVNVGFYNITQGNLALSDNYTLTFTSGVQFEIKKLVVTVTPTAAQSKYYGDLDPTLAYGFTPALAAGDSFTGALARDPGVNVGFYNITQGNLALSDNYTLTFTSGVQFEIKKLVVTVTPTAAQSKYYGDLDPTLAYGFTPALVAGDSFTGALARDPGVNVGFYNITQGNLALSDNYTLTFTSGVQFEIKKLVVTVTPTAAQSKYYGDLDPTLAYGFTPALVAGDGFTGALARDPGVNVGFYNITQGNLALSDNYTLTFTSGVQFEIKKLAVTVTAVTHTKPYDGNTSSVGVPTFSPALVGTDTPSFTQSFDNRNAGIGKTLTPAGVVNDGNSGNNYSYTYTPVATGEITKRGVTVTAATYTKPYDGNASSVGVPTFSPALIAPDSPSFTQNFDNRNAGTGKTLTPAGVVNDGNSGNNYSYTYTPVVTGVITKRGVTVTAVTDTKPYDRNTSSAGVPTFSPALIAPDSPSFTQGFDNWNAGTGKTLTPAGLVSDGNSGLNYSYIYTPVSTGTINKKPITVTAVADSKIWDGNTSSTGIPTIAPGLVTGDTPNFIQTFDTPLVGTDKTLTPSGNVNDGNSGLNYSYIYTPVDTGVITTGFCFNGFLSPIGGAVENAPPNGGSYADPVRSFKLGSTIPVKFVLNSLSVAGCGGVVTTGIHTLQALYYSSTVVSEAPIDATPTDAATTGNQFRLTGTEWHFNLSTKGGFKAGTWLLKATLQDGSIKTVWIAVKK